MAFARPVLQGKSQLAAGQRDKRVTIEQRPVEDTPGTSGFPVEDWTTLRREWMARRDLLASERFAVNQLSASAETQWHLPYAEDMDPEIVDVPKLRRLAFRGMTYDILSATLMGRREGIELMTLASIRMQ